MTGDELRVAEPAGTRIGAVDPEEREHTASGAQKAVETCGTLRAGDPGVEEDATDYIAAVVASSAGRRMVLVVFERTGVDRNSHR